MRKESLWEISVNTSLEAEDAVAELLSTTFDLPAAGYTNEQTSATVVSVYSPKAHAWTSAQQTALADGLKKVRASGLKLGAGRFSARRVALEDWAESWKRHFTAIEIGPKLLIKPPWIKRRPRKDQAVVVLDPGLSFGTGHHPTTAFCLHELAAGRRMGQKQSCWDIGTGSGILAIAAAKLGYAPVRGIDFDGKAVRIARENARLNGVSAQIQFQKEDLERLPRPGREKYDLICANLISPLLLRERERIRNRLRVGGTLVLAGILKREFPEVKTAFEQCGLKLARAKVEGEWDSGSFIYF